MVKGKFAGESAHQERNLSSLCYQFGHLARFFHLNALNSKGLSWGSNTNSPRRLLLSVQLSYCASDVFKEGISLCGPWNGRTRRRHNERGLASSSFSNEEATRGMNAVARSVSPAAALQGLVIMVILQDWFVQSLERCPMSYWIKLLNLHLNLGIFWILWLWLRNSHIGSFRIFIVERLGESRVWDRS